MARPRQFDENEVLAAITRVFWEKGFEATSLDDLLAASGLNKGSLYSSFGNKEALFKKALQHYALHESPSAERCGSPMQTLVSLYRSLIIDACSVKTRRKGCLVFNSAMELGQGFGALSKMVLKEVHRLEEFFETLIKSAKKKGELPSTLDAKKAAYRVYATAFSIREMAKFKPDKKFLTEIANGTLRSLGGGYQL